MADRFEVIAQEILELRKETLALRKDMRQAFELQQTVMQGALVSIQGILQVLLEDSSKKKSRKKK